MKYKVELRDRDGKLYKDNEGFRITANVIYFEDDNESTKAIEALCKNTALMYEAICKEGTSITIEVSDFNLISGTWTVLYSYYHNEELNNSELMKGEESFVKH